MCILGNPILSNFLGEIEVYHFFMFPQKKKRVGGTMIKYLY